MCFLLDWAFVPNGQCRSDAMQSRLLLASLVAGATKLAARAHPASTLLTAAAVASSVAASACIATATIATASVASSRSSSYIIIITCERPSNAGGTLEANSDASPALAAAAVTAASIFALSISTADGGKRCPLEHRRPASFERRSRRPPSWHPPRIHAGERPHWLPRVCLRGLSGQLPVGRRHCELWPPIRTMVEQHRRGKGCMPRWMVRRARLLWACGPCLVRDRPTL